MKEIITLQINDGVFKTCRTFKEIVFAIFNIDNLFTQGLYRKMGFVEISRRKGYYPTEGGREDAIVMQKALLEN